MLVSLSLFIFPPPEFKFCIANVKHDIPASFPAVIELPFIVLKTEQSCLLFQISSAERKKKYQQEIRLIANVIRYMQIIMVVM